MLQEYQGLNLLTKAGIKVPSNSVANSAEDAFDQAIKIGSFYRTFFSSDRVLKISQKNIVKNL